MGTAQDPQRRTWRGCVGTRTSAPLTTWLPSGETLRPWPNTTKTSSWISKTMDWMMVRDSMLVTNKVRGKFIKNWLGFFKFNCWLQSPQFNCLYLLKVHKEAQMNIKLSDILQTLLSLHYLIKSIIFRL